MANNQLQIPLDAFTPPPQVSIEDNPELKRLRYCHELWQEYSPRWDFYLSAYEGGEEFAVAANLFKHAREAQPDYDDRVKRLDNMNYCEPLVSFFTNFIFAESIDRNGGKNEDFFKTFINDVSRRGETVDDFMRQVCDEAQVFGLSYVLVDAPPLPETEGDTVSKQYEKDNNVRPYWVIIHPVEITDWETDDFGNLIYVKRKQLTVEHLALQNRKFEEYTEFYPDRYVTTRIDVTRATDPVILTAVTLPNKLGKVPILVARYRRSKRHTHLGISFLCDFAYNNRRILNINSMLDEFLYRQCFNILAKETEAGVPLREQEEGLIGTSNVMEYPKGAQPPKYISPPVDPAKILQDERGRIITQMFLRASQDTMNELFNGEKSSGFSQAQSFSRTVPFISSRADMLERVESALMQLTLQMVGKEWDGKIKYKDRYELTNLTSALTQLQVLVKDFQLPSETFVKTQLKRMVHEYDGKLSIEDQTAIEKEIDAMDFKAWAELQKEAFVGAPPTSPGAQQKPKQDMTVLDHENQQTGAESATVRIHE